MAAFCTVFIPLESGSSAYNVLFSSGDKGWYFHVLTFQNLTPIQQVKRYKNSAVRMVCGNPIMGLSGIRFP